MSGSTISTPLATAVTISAAGPYFSPLSITTTGTIATTNTAIQATSESAYIRNSGMVTNTAGFYNAIDLVGTLDNLGTITAQNAFAINAYSTASITNTGLIAGGQGGIGGDAGIMIVTGALDVTNSGTIESTQNNFGVDIAQSGAVDNSGLISGGTGYGVELLNGGTVTNSGTITGTTDAILITGTAPKQVVIAPGAVFNGDVKLIGGGLLELGRAATAGTLAGFGTAFTGFTSIAIDPGAAWELSGTTTITNDTSVTNAGTIIETPGDSLTLEGALNGTGVIDLGATTLALNSSVAAGQTISFSAPTAQLDIATLPNFEGTIAGLTIGDRIDLTQATITSETYVTGAGLELATNNGSETLAILGDYTTQNFTLQSDGALGTIITEVTCYAAGTQIATEHGNTAVEALKIGDRIKTLHAGLQPIKWIGVRSYMAPFASHPKVLPVRIAANAIADGIPARDLLVSPGHAICIDDALIHALRLVNGRTITQATAIDQITYYHIEMENHEVIFAEACPAETFCGEYFRPQFHNAAEFRALYPGHCAPEYPCLPQLESGFHLHAIQRRLAARAGLTLAAGAAPGPLRGYVDQAGPVYCRGWAQDESAPETPVCLDILAGGRVVGRTLANQNRPDVAAAGHGSGYHGFEFKLPETATGFLAVRRATDAAPLPFTDATQQTAAA